MSGFHPHLILYTPDALNARGQHLAGQHLANTTINPLAEELLWAPQLQETKQSSFGGVNIRYNHTLKSRMTDTFARLIQEEIPWCGIRYIFWCYVSYELTH